MHTSHRLPMPRWMKGAILAALTMLVVGVGATSALAQGPVWKVTSLATPTNLPPGDDSGNDSIILSVTNIGSGRAEGSVSPVTVTDQLPPGVNATKVAGLVRSGGLAGGTDMACVAFPVPTCSFAGNVLPYQVIQIVINVDVAANASSGSNHVSVAGAAAASASLISPVTVSASTPGFGFEQFEQTATNEDGSLDTQAGSHPYQFSTTADSQPEDWIWCRRPVGRSEASGCARQLREGSRF